MSLYLIINATHLEVQSGRTAQSWLGQDQSTFCGIEVLLLSFTVTMWVEGQLPETTPDWLVIGTPGLS